MLVKGDTFIKVGSRIKFIDERDSYVVQACAGYFAVCTKPFAPKKTVVYTIIDFDKDVRGCDNRIFSRGYETREECEANLADLLSGEMEVSHRRCVPLKIQWIKEDTRIPFDIETAARSPW